MPASVPRPPSTGAPAAAARTILLVEDDTTVRDAVLGAVGAARYRWLVAGTGADALAMASADPPDLVLLDLGLPDVDGLAVCEGLRRWSAVPIVVLSARHLEEEKVELLDAGADDYITKPFGPVELRARVEAHLRRARRPPRAPAALVRAGDLEIDLSCRVVRRAGTALHLTPTEWALLAALAATPGRTLTHTQLFRAVWGDGTFGQAQQYLRVYVTHLRKKIEPVAYAPVRIITEPGVGYRLAADEDGA